MLSHFPEKDRLLRCVTTAEQPLSALGTSRHFAALQALVAAGAKRT
jgi:hypothetical protein